MSEGGLLWRLVLALVLSSVIGVEREMRQKSAGLRTYALVGTGAALFMLVSEYGFMDTLGGHVTLDPSRVAAQIVSGIGFIGGGLIFVRRDNVRGLTTAAGVWTTAAVGMAAGGDLPLLATATTAIYLLVSYGYPQLTDRLPSSRSAPSDVRLTYFDGRGVLRELVAQCSAQGFAVSDLAVEHTENNGNGRPRAVTVRLELPWPRLDRGARQRPRRNRGCSRYERATRTLPQISDLRTAARSAERKEEYRAERPGAHGPPGDVVADVP